MKGKAARKKPKTPPRGSRPQPGEGIVLPKSLYAAGFRDALQQTLLALQQVRERQTLPGERAKAFAKALLGDRPPVPVSEHMRKAMLEEVRKPKRAPGRPKKNDDAKLLLAVDGLRAFYERRDGRPYDDKQAITEAVIEHKLMAPPSSMTREKAEGLLQLPGGEGLKLATQINTLVTYVQRERRKKI